MIQISQVPSLCVDSFSSEILSCRHRLNLKNCPYTTSNRPYKSLLRKSQQKINIVSTVNFLSQQLQAEQYHSSHQSPPSTNIRMKGASSAKSSWFCEAGPSFYRGSASSHLFCCNRIKTHSLMEEQVLKNSTELPTDGAININFSKKQQSPTDDTENFDATENSALLTKNSNMSANASPAHTSTLSSYPSTLSNPCLSVPNLLTYNPSVTSRLKYKLIKESEGQVCRLNHTKTLVSKIMNSRYLRRWENHTLVLGDSEIYSTTPTGSMELSIPYSCIQDVNVVSRWDDGHKYCVRITVSDGSVLIQAGNSYLRDQWLHSIQWKRHTSKYDKLLRHTKRVDVLMKEIKQLIGISLSTPLQDDSVSQFPLDLMSVLLKENEESINNETYEQIIVTLAPLLDKNLPTNQMYAFFTKQCRNSPRSPVTFQLFSPVIHRIFKHNVEVGRYIEMQTFVQEYLRALQSHNNSTERLASFVESLHGPSTKCPHPRMLPNLVAICLSSIFSYYERINSEYEDWRLQLASLLQPIPFPDMALKDALFMKNTKRLLSNLVDDARCEVHGLLLGAREGKMGWFELYHKEGVATEDEGCFYGNMLKRLISCCCRRKRFFASHVDMVPVWELMALRGHPAAIEALCLVLEHEVLPDNDTKIQLAATLQATDLGKEAYKDLSDRLIQLQEIQQKGGPRKLSLPSNSTDDDLHLMISSGSFGNLEYLSLAFTQVTSGCARDLIKLPSLLYLNLWSTQFGDHGLQTISEYMPKLQVLNLCETPVTDKGLTCLAAMRSLRRLNLNSTHLSAPTFQILKEKLPSLQEVDVRYTDAW